MIFTEKKIISQFKQRNLWNKTKNSIIIEQIFYSIFIRRQKNKNKDRDRDNLYNTINKNLKKKYYKYDFL